MTVKFSHQFYEEGVGDAEPDEFCVECDVEIQPSYYWAGNWDNPPEADDAEIVRCTVTCCADFDGNVLDVPRFPVGSEYCPSQGEIDELDREAKEIDSELRATGGRSI